MGSVHAAKCNSCEHKFEFSEGGGFNFALINCDTCHNALSVSWEEKNERITHGKCKCGGTFTNNAKPRCEMCNSLDISDLGITIMFD